jgi:hypothetical protein
MVPVCAKCRIEMRIKKTGIDVEEMAGCDSPYRIWSADLFSCQGCGHEVVVGFGKTPISEHYKPEYADIQKTVKVRFWPRISDLPADLLTPEEIANARLICAAPDLLSALRGLWALIESGHLRRNTSHDGDPDWEVHQTHVLRGIKAARREIEKATEGV